MRAPAARAPRPALPPPAQVLFLVEDRESVVQMWRAAGYVCLQCAPGEF